ncbi:MAG: hypothetical protein AAFV88_18550 [Planctomycetota bacterium]
MTIEDLDKIDLIGNADGALILVAIDLGNLDGDARLGTLLRKLDSYRKALGSKQFREEHPNWRTASIKVTCAVAPTEAMKEVEAITAGSPEELIAVPVEYELIE